MRNKCANHKMRKIALMISLCLFVHGLVLAQKTAFEINQRLGRGINMGNAFEAPTETAWGNQWKPEYFQMMAELGFSHVRVPVRWEPSDRSMREDPYTIYPVFLERIKTVVDEALKNNLQIIINMHHHEALLDDPIGEKPRFLAQWKQIAEYFKDYSDSLLFEILNEPNGNLTSSMWNSFVADALEVIRESNPDRTILVGTANWGGIDGLSYLQLPNDDNLIVTIHYYNPFSFTHQGAEWNDPIPPTGIKWYDSEPERETVIREFEPVLAFAKKNNVPIHIGEFGSYSAADMDSRVRWTTFLARYMEEQGFSWAYWEFSAGFGIYDLTTKTYHTRLVDALLHNPIPEPAEINYTSVYKSDYSSGTDGWFFYQQSPCEGFLVAEDGKLKLTINTAGEEGWHGQLIKTGISLEKDQTYRISFTVSSSTSKAFTNYVGMNYSPYSAYSDYNAFIPEVQEKEFSYSFTMTTEETAARISFDLGTAASSFTFSSIQLDKMQITPTGIEEKASVKNVSIYPNPVQNDFFIQNENGIYKQLWIYSFSGSLLGRHILNPGENTIAASSWKSGIYILYLKGEGVAYQSSMVKF